jgi:membrane-bound ClpP family serine protease
MSVIKKTLIIIGIGILVWELTEHVLLPLIWYVIHGKRKPLVGMESMIGREVEVATWENLDGQVSFRGVLWTASSDDCLTPGETAVIEEANGLILRIKRSRPTKATRPE